MILLNPLIHVNQIDGSAEARIARKRIAQAQVRRVLTLEEQGSNNTNPVDRGKLEMVLEYDVEGDSYGDLLAMLQARAVFNRRDKAAVTAGRMMSCLACAFVFFWTSHGGVTLPGFGVSPSTSKGTAAAHSFGGRGGGMIEKTDKIYCSSCGSNMIRVASQDAIKRARARAANVRRDEYNSLARKRI